MIALGNKTVGDIVLNKVPIKPISDMDYLYFQAEENNVSVYLTAPSTFNVSFEISRDGSAWSTWNYTTNANSVKVFSTIQLNTFGDYVFIRAAGTNTWSASVYEYMQFVTDGGLVKCGGSIMSLLSNDLSVQSLSGKDYCFFRLFDSCANLTTPPELPAETLTVGCYNSMFNGCTNLATAPELPVMTLADSCYGSMFKGCTSLETAPELPATTLGQYCYQSMFRDCTSLTTAPELQARTLKKNCYNYMFMNCTSLIATPALPATTLADYCYSSMFQGCTNLISAPAELPVMTLFDNCYSNMFKGCTSLATAPELPSETLATYCYYQMFSGCTVLAAVQTELPATTLANYCYSYMFDGCVSLTTAPELPATTLATNCYQYMFQNCVSLNHIKVGATSWNTSYASNWVANVASTGTFVKPSGITITSGASGIPNNWTVEGI